MDLVMYGSPKEWEILICSYMYLSKGAMIYLYRTGHQRWKRLGALNIKCNTDRYKNIPYEERICSLCTMNKIEYEYHHCVECPKFDKIRKKYLPDWFNNCSRVFYVCAKKQKSKLMSSLAKYLYLTMLETLFI